MDPSSDPPLSINCAVEEEKIWKGIELILTDNLNEGEEYFEAMKPGSFRYSLVHAEVASYVGLVSFEDSDIQRATALLSETEALAGQLALKYRTHSNYRKVNAAVSTIKKLTIGRISKRLSTMVVPARSPTPDIEDEESPEQIAAKLEQKVLHHRLRRSRLWALLIQSECSLLSSILQIVSAGDSWSTIVKVGYNLNRTWGLYQHCRSKLKQLHREWITMGGTFDLQGKAVDDSDISSESDDEDKHKLDDFHGTKGLHPIGESSGGDSSPVLLNLEDITHEASKLLVLDAQSGIKEDEELHSLRIGMQFGEGAFNLILSLIPPNYQKALEVMRFPYDRERGLALLKKTCAANHPATPLAYIILLYYHTAIMGLLPYSSKHAKEAQELMNQLPSAWRSSSLFRILSSRIQRYDRHINEATMMVTTPEESPYKITGKGNMRKLRSLMVDELGWCLLLQGKFSEAAACFESLMQESVSFKVHYAFLLSSCLWETDEAGHHKAGQILKELPALVANKKQLQLTPLEEYALQIASKFIATNQAPLFPALEIAAMFNGFQFVDKASLESHKRLVEDVLRGRTQMHKLAPETQDMLTGEASAPNSPNGEASVRTRLHYEHKWAKPSKMLCRFILALIQKNLGEIEKADDNFRYVIDNAETFIGNIVPYSCYELGSMLLQQDSSSVEGFQLLERCLTFPAHEFQGRLRLVCAELLKRYNGNAANAGISPERI